MNFFKYFTYNKLRFNLILFIIFLSFSNCYVFNEDKLKIDLIISKNVNSHTIKLMDEYNKMKFEEEYPDSGNKFSSYWDFKKISGIFIDTFIHAKYCYGESSNRFLKLYGYSFWLITGGILQATFNNNFLTGWYPFADKAYCTIYVIDIPKESFNFLMFSTLRDTVDYNGF